MRQSIKWYDSTKKEYEYEIYGLEEKLPSGPANYCYAIEPTPNRWRAVYFGQTNDLKTISGTEIMKKHIENFPATHIHIRLDEKNCIEKREKERKKLIAFWNPPYQNGDES